MARRRLPTAPALLLLPLALPLLASPLAAAVPPELLAWAGPACAAREAPPDIPGAGLESERSAGAPDGPAWRLQRRLSLAEGGALELLRIEQGGRLLRLSLQLEDAEGRPQALLLLDGDCAPNEARVLERDARGTAVVLRLYRDGELETPAEREELKPPVPPGRDPGGPRIAQADSGVAYGLPLFDGRLARDGAGRFLGYDFRDQDDRPFDRDGPDLFPRRHGTLVASILLREAPEAVLLPYRFPRGAMDRMGELVEAAAEAGARVLLLPMGSDDPEDWRAFLAAAERHPEILFVLSAGNDGRDLDEAPVWPAAAGLENALVVTSADGFGRLAQGSNWGRGTVDLMLPAERLEALDHRGAAVQASGSSYAVPRLGALAARLLAAEPGLDTAALKAAILARALPSPFERTPRVRHGWIPEPSEGP